jgi:LPS export ABC transporter permease LptG
VVLRIPQAIPMAFPFACLFAALLAMGRVMGDNELTAMRTAGISVMRIAVAPLAFGLAMFLLAYGMNEYVRPPSVDLSTRTFYQIIYHTDSLPVEPQFFRKDSDTGNVFYVSQVGPDNKTMLDVQIFKPARYGPWNETLQAKDATVKGSSLELHDVIDTRYNNDGFMTNQQHVKVISIGLPLGETAAQFVSSVNNDPWTMSSKSLRTQVNALEAQGIGGTTLGNLQINLANQLAWPFACFIGIVLAIPMALRFGKRGRTLGIALAIILFFVYYLMTSAAAAFGRNGAINPFLAAWLPNIIMGTAGTVLLWMEER